MLTRKQAQSKIKEWAHQMLTSSDALRAIDALVKVEEKKNQVLLLAEKQKLVSQIYSHAVKITLSSTKQDWLTPPYFLNIVRRVGPIALDPCANPFSFVYAWKSFHGPNHICGLTNSWWVPEGTVCFVNPPYGRSICDWVAKMVHEYGDTKDNRGDLIALIPSRTGTGYWEQFIWPFADAVCFWHGGTQFPSRIKFYGLDGRPAELGATFDAAVVYFGKCRDRFASVFSEYGRVQLCN